MQGKMYPAYIDGVIVLEFFNTDRTEITPGSNVVGEDFEEDIFVHQGEFPVVARWIGFAKFGFG